MRAEVIAIGDELVSGQRLDTNSRWLSAEMALLGIPTAFHVTAADTIEAGVDAFRTAIRRADVVVATGGLGPTADDLTRDVLANVADVPLESSIEALAAVEARFARRGAQMPESNRRQALFPRGSRIIPNPDGTAPGIDLVVTSAGRPVRVFALPGVPSEMRGMWQATVAPALLAMQPEAATIVQRRVKCFGAGESAVEAMLPDLIRRGRDPLVGITVHEATITLRIAACGRDEAACLARIEPVEATIRAALGPLVFGVEDDEVEDAAITALSATGRTLGTAEIGTEGRVATLLGQAQGRAGAAEPARFRGGIVLPATAVGDAAELAETARRHFDAALGLAVGRVGRGADGRDVVGIVLTNGRHAEAREHILGGSPGLARARAAKTAVDLVRRGEGPASHG